MNQINIDSLLRIGSTSKPELQLRLDPTQLYQALLKIGADDDARLQIQTPQGQVQVQLPVQVARQVLQSTQQSLLQSTAISLNVASHTVTPTTTAQTTQAQTTQSQTTQTQTTQSRPAGAPSPTGSVSPGLPTAPDSGLREARLLVQLEPVGQQLLLTLRPSLPPVQLQLQPDQLLQLLRHSPAATDRQLSAQGLELSQQLSSAAPTQRLLQWPVQLSRQHHQWQLRLPAGDTVQLSAAQLPELAKMTGPLQARLELSAASGQWRLQLQPAAATQASPVTLKPAAAAQLLPALARQQWPEQLQGDLSGWLSQARIKAPASSAQSWQWQLQANPDQSVRLALQPQSQLRQLRLDSQDFSRPLQFGNSSQTPTPASQTDSRDLWRQLLPLSAGKPDPLADTAELPAPVRQLLQEIRSQLPDPARQQNVQQLIQQINAALQFNPLQLPAQPNSAAGTLAIAIQLLLGRLGAQLPAERQPLPQKDKLQQLIGQLDRSQSAQLLRQLSGHSRALQSAQVANLEQQGQPAGSKLQEQQLFIQLPLLQQGQSSFTELAVGEREAEGGDAHNTQRCWVLTMKFDLGTMGELLVKVQLTGKEVSLQFYAEQPHTVAQADQFLPLFKDRLKMQGLQPGDVGCQLGKIPQHLYKQGTSLLQVRV